jgi:sulfate/thiosulfate transport system ATP-binding protein
LELTDAREGRAIEVELDQRQHAALALAPGDAVHLSPRRVRVFPQGEARDSLTASSL